MFENHFYYATICKYAFAAINHEEKHLDLDKNSAISYALSCLVEAFCVPVLQIKLPPIGATRRSQTVYRSALLSVMRIVGIIRLRVLPSFLLLYNLFDGDAIVPLRANSSRHWARCVALPHISNYATPVEPSIFAPPENQWGDICEPQTY